MNDEALRGIEASLLENGLDPAAWSHALDTISYSAGAFGAVLLPIRSRVPGVPCSSEATELLDDYFRGGWAARDRRQTGVPQLLRTGIVADQDYITPERMARDPYWQEFLEPIGLRWFCGVKVAADDEVWCLALQRTPGQGAFTPAEQAGLLRVAAPLSRAATLARHVNLARLGGVADGLDAVGGAGILLDRTGRVIRMNRGAQRLVDEDVTVLRGEITVRNDAGASAALRRLVEAVLWQGIAPDSPALRPVTLPRRDRRPLVVHGQLLVGAVADCFTPARVLLLITDPDETLVPSAHVLRQLFPLSNGEIQLALALATLFQLSKAAERAGLTYESARSYLKSIFAKTGTRNQGELISLLARIALRGSANR